MPRFTIYPIGLDAEPIELLSADVVPALDFIQRYELEEADVLRDQVYQFTLRLNGGGFWSVFKRAGSMSMTGALVMMDSAVEDLVCAQASRDVQTGHPPLHFVV